MIFSCSLINSFANQLICLRAERQFALFSLSSGPIPKPTRTFSSYTLHQKTERTAVSHPFAVCLLFSDVQFLNQLTITGQIGLHHIVQ
jgi:hypothetical protein